MALARMFVRPSGPRLDPLDCWMAGLRAVALVGGLGWLLLHVRDHPIDPHAHRQTLALFLAFGVYSVGLYLINAWRPGHVRPLYRAAMAVDLAFLLMLVRVTGGMLSNFYLAFYLLIALHAFYFGLATGTALAVLTGGLYVLLEGSAGVLSPSDLGLRVGFFLLVGVCMGGLAERERRERWVVERLNRQLEEQQQGLKVMQEQLIRSDRLATVGELAASLAHDLRNPLTGISGALHVLSGELPEENSQQALLAEIQLQIGRMNKTLTDLLWHARPATPECLPLSVNEVVEHSLWFFPIGSPSGIRVRKDLAPDLPPLRLDPNLLHQAFLNILVNARQAMPEGGTLAVRSHLRRNGDGTRTIEVEIADSGVGIPPEHLKRIFQPFFTTKAQGTGLGLAIAVRIVEQHGGRIDVESQPKQGATFRISLPVPTDHAAGETDDGIEGPGR